MAAGEDQLQPLIGELGLIEHLDLVLHCLRHLQETGLRGERPIASEAVDRSVAGGDDQPGAGIRRRAILGPAFGRDRERVLRGFLRELEVAEVADQRRHNATPLLAERLLDSCHGSTSGRISIAPPRRAAGIWAASSIA